MNELNIYQKIMEVRVEILNAGIKKTGYNKFSNFPYFELKDFLRVTINSFTKIKLYSRFSIIPATPTSEETATLTIINSEKPDEVEVYTIPTAECFIGRKKDGTGGADPIQNLGGKITYLRRYMYLIALDLIEDDSVDSKEQIAKKQVKKETKEDISVTYKKIIDLKLSAEDTIKWEKYYKVNSLFDCDQEQMQFILDRFANREGKWMSEETKQIYEELHGDKKLTPKQIEAEKQELPFADISSYKEGDD